MFDLLRRWTLALLKAPPEPQPPIGDPASLRVFRAGVNYFRLRMAGWVAAELVALGGLIFWTAFLIEIGDMARTQKEAREAQLAAAANPNPAPRESDTRSGAPSDTKRRRDNWPTRVAENIRTAATEPEVAGRTSRKGKRIKGWAGFKQGGVEVVLMLPGGAMVLLWALKIFGTLLYLAQLPVTYAVRRLDYEMRWYMVTDRSLRLRHGVWRISESTMSFANIQQVVVSQGPLQRL